MLFLVISQDVFVHRLERTVGTLEFHTLLFMLLFMLVHSVFVVTLVPTVWVFTRDRFSVGVCQYVLGEPDFRRCLVVAVSTFSFDFFRMGLFHMLSEIAVRHKLTARLALCVLTYMVMQLIMLTYLFPCVADFTAFRAAERLFLILIGFFIVNFLLDVVRPIVRGVKMTAEFEFVREDCRALNALVVRRFSRKLARVETQHVSPVALLCLEALLTNEARVPHLLMYLPHVHFQLSVAMEANFAN